MPSITEWIGIYGGVLATGVFLWNIIRNRPSVKITFGIRPDTDSGRPCIMARVHNTGMYPVKLYSYAFVKIDRYRLLKNVSHIPRSIEDMVRNAFFMSVTTWVEIEIPSGDHRDILFTIDDTVWEAENSEVHILNRIFIEDRTGRTYTKKIPGYVLEEAHITSNKQRS